MLLFAFRLKCLLYSESESDALLLTKCVLSNEFELQIQVNKFAVSFLEQLEVYTKNVSRQMRLECESDQPDK